MTRERALRAAVRLADREGLPAVSMRRLGQDLGVEAMSLYNHVRDKEDLLDGMADLVVAEIAPVGSRRDWMDPLREQILAARAVLKRHRWAPSVIETRRTPGQATMAYFERILAILRDGGFTVDLAHHALHVLGSRVLGFTQELFEDSGRTGKLTPEEAALLAGRMAERFPRLTEMAASVTHGEGLGGGCDDDVEFAFALDMTLDGLERLRKRAN